MSKALKHLHPSSTPLAKIFHYNVSRISSILICLSTNSGVPWHRVNTFGASRYCIQSYSAIIRIEAFPGPRDLAQAESNASSHLAA